MYKCMTFGSPSLYHMCGLVILVIQVAICGVVSSKLYDHESHASTVRFLGFITAAESQIVLRAVIVFYSFELFTSGRTQLDRYNHWKQDNLRILLVSSLFRVS
jgi:hypothetical protein